MNRKIIISVVIVLLGIVVVSGVFLQDMDGIPPVGNITPNETRVTPTRVTPNETRIQTKISKEEAMRLAEHNSKYWGPDIGPPRIGGIVLEEIPRPKDKQI